MYNALKGQNPNGTWYLRITDKAAGNVGRLDSWSLYIKSGEAEPGLSGWTVFLIRTTTESWRTVRHIPPRTPTAITASAT